MDREHWAIEIDGGEMSQTFDNYSDAAQRFQELSEDGAGARISLVHHKATVLAEMYA